MNRLNELSDEERATLKLILQKFKDVDELFESLPEDVKFETLDFHFENHTLNHCIRWGYQATEDLLINSETLKIV